VYEGADHGPGPITPRSVYRGSPAGEHWNVTAFRESEIVERRGWDDNLGGWLVKNSWGDVWGNNGGFGSEGGYGWVAYGSNNIGMHAIWIDALRDFYKLPQDWSRILSKAGISVKPLPHPDPRPLGLTIRPRPD
jgi:hypothetical protein